jgi:hypothetical protein
MIKKKKESVPSTPKSPLRPFGLQFNPALYQGKDIKDIRLGLSTVVRTDKYLWLSCDESWHLERLTIQNDSLANEHIRFDLSDIIELPEKEQEIDIEGIDFYDNCLWITGSHSLKRKKPTNDADFEALSEIESEANRYLIAQIPLNENFEPVEYFKTSDNKEIFAKTLKYSCYGNKLTKALRHDIHFGEFLNISGKDNGFDIEGLTYFDDKIFLGLRGPVLRGWAGILAIEPKDKRHSHHHKHTFSLKRLGERKYHKYFLNLEGKGIREIIMWGSSMLILAGPTMDLDGIISIYLWKNPSDYQEDSIVRKEDIVHLIDVTSPTNIKNYGKDKAEGMTKFNEQEVMIVFDSPKEERLVKDGEVIVDIWNIAEFLKK